jgi:hypothetical protein
MSAPTLPSGGARRAMRRGPHRQRAVVVDEQVTEEHPGPQPAAAEIYGGDAHAGGQPHDRRNRTADLEPEHQLRRAVVRRGQREHGQRIREPLASEVALRVNAPRYGVRRGHSVSDLPTPAAPGCE